MGKENQIYKLLRSVFIWSGVLILSGGEILLADGEVPSSTPARPSSGAQSAPTRNSENINGPAMILRQMCERSERQAHDRRSFVDCYNNTPANVIHAAAIAHYLGLPNHPISRADFLERMRNNGPLLDYDRTEAYRNALLDRLVNRRASRTCSGIGRHQERVQCFNVLSERAWADVIDRNPNMVAQRSSMNDPKPNASSSTAATVQQATANRDLIPPNPYVDESHRNESFSLPANPYASVSVSK